MREKPSDQAKNRVLGTAAAVLMAFNVVIWVNVLTADAWTPPTPKLLHASMPTEDPHDGPVAAEKEDAGEPVRIMIPGIAVDAEVEKVALAEDGSMDVPKQPFDTAWYALGPRPGETGSATIAGHIDWMDNSAAVFADLHKLKPGDTIFVQDDKGAIISFVVRETRMYDADADAFDVFVSNDGKAHLNLITCSGTWDKRAKQYAERLVVFTDKVTE